MDGFLVVLASALRSGRLVAPFSAVSVRRYAASSHAGAVAAYLQERFDDGMPPRHLAALVETLAETRAQCQQPDLVDLVWTGPEAPGVTNRDTGVVVRELFGSAESEVLVAGFAVYQGRAIFKRLAERMEERPALRVRLYLDVQRHPADTTLRAEMVRRFVHRFRTQEWPGEKLPELYFDPRSLELDKGNRSSLHAKCIVVDRRHALVTSANFTEAAQKRNIEVGALIRSGSFAASLAGHFDTLTAQGGLERLPG